LNTTRNDPYKESHHPRYTKLNKVDDSKIKEIGMKRFEESFEDVNFLDPERDHSSKNLENK